MIKLELNNNSRRNNSYNHTIFIFVFETIQEENLNGIIQ